MNDPAAGLRLRIGEVGQELAYSLAEAGNIRAAREAASRPHVGLWFSKTF